MTLEEKVKAFEAKLWDRLTDEGYVVHSITLGEYFGDRCYRVVTDKGHATFLVSFQTDEFLRMVDMEPGFGV